MNIYDFALQMELDGEKFYRDLAAKTQHSDLKIVLEGLANDEQRHYQIIQQVQNQTLHDIDVNPSLDQAKNVFSSNKESFLLNKEIMTKLKYEQIDVYRAAFGKEQESVELYKKLAEAAMTAEEKALCEKLMHEEEKHVEVLDDIIEMLNHVNDWVEAAEFNHKKPF
ncbi:ferritin family protein [bacterium BFN5]|nr:ferritin family protein [bacterium BFN5]